MIALIGLALLALTFGVSVLAYALPIRSRSRLSELLPEQDQESRLDWVDEHELELETLASLLRLMLGLGVAFIVLHCVRMELGTAGWTAWLVAGVTSLTALAIFAIGVPHALAAHAGDAVLARSLGILWLLRTLLWPVGRLFLFVEFVVRRLLGKIEQTAEAETERAEQDILDAVSEGEAYGAVDEDKKEMIQSVFKLDETAVSAIMTPRTDVDAVAADAGYEDVRALILRTGHSRIPVYEGSVDHIVGVLYAKDLLRLNPAEPFDARKAMRTAPYVPETKTLNELLNEFRSTKVQIAIVLDEYGGTAGLATLEDILEELVGEIDDEYDQRPPPALIRIDDDTLEVDARVHISEINAELEIELPEEADYETIGGFVFATLGKIPTADEEFRKDNIEVRILDAEPRRIRRLRIHVVREGQESRVANSE